MSTKAQRIGSTEGNVHLYRLVGHIVEVTLGVGLLVVYCGGYDAMFQSQGRGNQFNRTLGIRLYIPTGYYNLMDHDEARREGWDLADVVMG